MRNTNKIEENVKCIININEVIKNVIHDINIDVSFGHTWIFLPTKCCFDVTQTINLIGIMSIYLQVHVHEEYIS